VISFSQGLYLYTNTEKRTPHTPNIQGWCWIRTHDPGFRASEDSACLRPLGYRDRYSLCLLDVNQLKEDSRGHEFQYCVVTDLSACRRHYQKPQCLGPRIKHQLPRELLPLSPEESLLLLHSRLTSSQTCSMSSTQISRLLIK
jgi:hypothetical protein